MKNLAKLVVVSFFAIGALCLFLSVGSASRNGSVAMAEVNLLSQIGPTPPANTATPAAGDKTLPKNFVLAKDSLSEYGEVKCDHEAHAFKNYSPDGKSVMGCAECHHTEQPKSALKPPLSTSERNVTLTFDIWKSSTQKVSECRACHFQAGSVPEGKTMPSAAYTEGGKSTTKDMTNELAFHINCNTCHDEAFKLRPELKKRP